MKWLTCCFNQAAFEPFILFSGGRSKQARQRVWIPHCKSSGWKAECGGLWLTALHLCRWSLDCYLYLLKLSTLSGYAGGYVGVIAAIENSQRKGKPGLPASGWSVPALQSSCPCLSRAPVAAQQYRSLKAPWGNRSQCLYRVLSWTATEVQVIIFCQLCMNYHWRWHGSSAVLQGKRRFSISTSHRGLYFGSKWGRGQLLSSTEKV